MLRAMRIEATLLKDELRSLLESLLPVRIALDKNEPLRWIEFGKLHALELVPGHGARIVCSAKVSWPLPVIGPRLSVRHLEALIQPYVRSGDGGEVLAFKIQLESIELAHVPAFVEREVLRLINGELAQRKGKLAWKIGKTFANRIKMPTSLAPVEGLQLHVAEASFQLLEDRVMLGLFVNHAFVHGKPTSHDELEDTA